MKKTSDQIKQDIIDAGYEAISQLISIAKKDITRKSYDDDEDGEEKAMSPSGLKNAAQAKKIAVFDAFEILTKIEMEEQMLKSGEGDDRINSKKGFAERRSS